MYLSAAFDARTRRYADPLLALDFDPTAMLSFAATTARGLRIGLR
jgi:hypothetical protein